MLWLTAFCDVPSAAEVTPLPSVAVPLAVAVPETEPIAGGLAAALLSVGMVVDGLVIAGVAVVAALLVVFTPDLPRPEGFVPMLPAFADRIALPTPTELDALVPAVPGGLFVAPGVPAGWTPALADRAAVPTPIDPEALVPCVPSGGGVTSPLDVVF